MELVPIKVKIGLKNNGHHRFPSFNELASALRDNVDWSVFVDKFGGWHYDQVCGHAEEDVTSPRGNWNGMLLVPEDFANAAVAAFPDECSILTETEAEKFYEERGHIREPAIREDTERLQAIQAKGALGIAQDQGDLNALDPDHPAPGLRRNKKKTFAGFKTEQGITVKV